MHFLFISKRSDYFQVSAASDCLTFSTITSTSTNLFTSIHFFVFMQLQTRVDGNGAE